ADLKVVRVTLRDLGDVDGAEAVVREAVAEARSLGDDALLGQAVNHASVVAGQRGDHLEAARAFAQAFEDASSVRPVNRSIAQGLSLVARLHADVGDHERAYALSEYLLAEPLTQ